MSHAKRSGLIGVVTGLCLAALFIYPQAKADLQGYKIIGPAELMFVTSVPISLMTWAAWLLPATSAFGPGGGAIPPWVGYTWMLVTPPLNWGVIGWLIGRWRDRRSIKRSV